MIKQILIALLLACINMSYSNYGVNHKYNQEFNWSFSKGNLVKNWSFEDINELWIDEDSDNCPVLKNASHLREGSTPQEVCGENSAATIEVVAGTYGENCGASYGNKTSHLTSACDGKTSCDYVIDYQVIGDPVVNCAKTYKAEYKCSGSDKVYSVLVSEEAGFKKIAGLRCMEASTGNNVGVFTGSNEYSAPIRVKSDQLYKLSLKFRMTSGEEFLVDPNLHIDARFYENCFIANGELTSGELISRRTLGYYITQCEDASCLASWASFETEFLSPESEDNLCLELEPHADSYTGGNAVLYVDDVVLHEQNNPITGNYDFEIEDDEPTNAMYDWNNTYGANRETNLSGDKVMMGGYYMRSYIAVETFDVTLNHGWLSQDIEGIDDEEYYTLSLYHTSHFGKENDVYYSSFKPVIKFKNDSNQPVGEIEGVNTYHTNWKNKKDESSARNFVRYVMHFKPDPGTTKIELVLAPSSSPIYTVINFDNAGIFRQKDFEENMGINQVTQSLSYVEDGGRLIQSQAKKHNGLRVIAANKYDEYGRVAESSLPVIAMPNDAVANFPSTDELFTQASSQYNGGALSDGKTVLGDANGNTNSAITYRDEDNVGGAMVSKTKVGYIVDDGDGTPGEDEDVNLQKSGAYFVSNLEMRDIATIDQRETDHEMEYLFGWSVDVNGQYSCSWANRKGQVVQRAQQTNPSKSTPEWAISQMEYYPTGELKKTKTPLDIQRGNENFATIYTYDVSGRVISSYRKGSGLKRFWYDQRGNLKLTQDDGQRAEGIFSYYEYDYGNRLRAEGVLYLTEENRGSKETGKQNEIKQSLINKAFFDDAHKRPDKEYLYNNLSTFESKTGLELASVLPDGIELKNTFNGLAAEWNWNHSAKIPFKEAKDKIVINLYSYNFDGSLDKAYTYIGGSLHSNKLYVTEYEYNKGKQLVKERNYKYGAGSEYESIYRYKYNEDGLLQHVLKNGEYEPIVSYDYDEFGRIVRGIYYKGRATAPNHTYGFAYTWNGTLFDIILDVSYKYHLSGGISEILAMQGSEIVFHEKIGYENKVVPDNITLSEFQGRADGKISQIARYIPTYVNIADGEYHVRNYTYDMRENMTNVDVHTTRLVSGELSSTQSHYDPLTSYSSEFAYDNNGRKTQQTMWGSTMTFGYGENDDSYKVSSVDANVNYYGNFQRSFENSQDLVYSKRNEVIRDLTQDLAIMYDNNSMASELIKPTGNAGQFEVEYYLYDAAGNRVLVLGGLKDDLMASNNLIISETDPTANYPNIKEAYTGVATKVAGTHINDLPDKYVFNVVIDEGGVLGESATNFDLVPYNKSGTIIPIEVVVLYTGSQAHLDLQEGRYMFTAGDAKVYNGKLVEIQTGGNAGDVSQIRFKYPGGVGEEIGVANKQEVFHVQDYQGSNVISISNEQQPRLHGSYGYSPTGLPQAALSGELAPDEKYTGKEMDGFTGYYYYGARYWDPILGLWMTVDPAMQFSHPYTNGGDFINYIDPDGRYTSATTTSSGGNVYYSSFGVKQWAPDGASIRDGNPSMFSADRTSYSNSGHLGPATSYGMSTGFSIGYGGGGYSGGGYGTVGASYPSLLGGSMANNYGGSVGTYNSTLGMHGTLSLGSSQLFSFTNYQSHSYTANQVTSTRQADYSQSVNESTSSMRELNPHGKSWLGAFGVMASLTSSSLGWHISKSTLDLSSAQRHFDAAVVQRGNNNITDWDFRQAKAGVRVAKSNLAFFLRMSNIVGGVSYGITIIQLVRDGKKNGFTAVHAGKALNATAFAAAGLFAVGAPAVIIVVVGGTVYAILDHYGVIDGFYDGTYLKQRTNAHLRQSRGFANDLGNRWPFSGVGNKNRKVIRENIKVK